MKKFNITKKKRKLFAVAAFVSVLTIFVFVKILIPFGKQWNEQSTQIKLKKISIKNFKTSIKNKDDLESNFTALTKKIQDKLPETRKESQFLNEIGKVATDTNVHIATMNPRPLREVGSFKELSVEIEMEANLGNLVRFLHQMRESSVVLVANNLQLQPKSERSALLKGHLVISTIFLKDK
jgi:Tfp pilus assembly protein PilO